MSLYAQVQNGVVVNCIVADITFIASLPNATEFHEYNQERPACIGWLWHNDAQRAIAPQPFPSWTLDDDYRWQAPVPYPTDGGDYTWDEGTKSWVKFEL